METVTQWRCEPNCPVRLLDEQTGERSVSGSAQAGKPTVNGSGAIFGAGTHSEGQRFPNDSGGASRFVLNTDWGHEHAETRFRYIAKASSAERNAGLDGFEEREMGEFSGGMGGGASIPLKGSPPPRYRNVHPTVKPIALMRWLVRLVTPPGGTCLDPFAGSGTTGAAAVLEDFRFIGIEREPEYAAIAQARIAWWAAHPDGMLLVERLEHEKKAKAIADAGQIGFGF
jgi:site-specific DNA-methyltransferase (adenine-specific)